VTVAVPDPVTLAGVIAPQVKPVGTASARETTPVNPFTAVMVIVEVAETPTVTAAGEEAEIVKSTNWKLTDVELLAPVAVAVTEAEVVWAVASVQVSVDVPPAGIAIVVGLREHDAARVEVTARVTVFEKPPRDATVIVEVPPGAPTFALTLVGLALRLMPGGGPAAVIVTEMGPVEFVMRLFVPPVPVIATEKVVVVVTVPDNVHVVVPVPAATRVTEVGLQATPTPDGEEVEPIATAPANWKLVAPRLVRVTPT
jgi:hypothetical protein